MAGGNPPPPWAAWSGNGAEGCPRGAPNGNGDMRRKDYDGPNTYSDPVYYGQPLLAFFIA